VQCASPWLTQQGPSVYLLSCVSGGLGVIAQRGSLYLPPGGEWESDDHCHTALQAHLRSQFHFSWTRFEAFGPYTSKEVVYYKTYEKVPGLTYISDTHVSLTPDVRALIVDSSRHPKTRLDRVEFSNGGVPCPEKTLSQCLVEGITIHDLDRQHKGWRRQVNPSTYIYLGDIVLSVSSLQDPLWKGHVKLVPHVGEEDVDRLRTVALNVPIGLSPLSKMIGLNVNDTRDLVVEFGFVVENQKVMVSSEKFRERGPQLSTFSWKDFFTNKN